MYKVTCPNVNIYLKGTNIVMYMFNPKTPTFHVGRIFKGVETSYCRMIHVINM